MQGARHARKRTDAEPARGTWICRYVYEDLAGQPLHGTVRFADPKAFRQQRFVRGQWRWGLRGIQPVLYRLPQLCAAPRHLPVFIVEGEKDVDRLLALGVVATCNAMGAGKWQDYYARWLAGRDVVIVEDNDEAGRQHAGQIVQSLRGVARSVRVLRFTASPGADMSDWLDQGNAIEDLLAGWGYASPGRMQEGA